MRAEIRVSLRVVARSARRSGACPFATKEGFAPLAPLASGFRRTIARFQRGRQVRKPTRCRLSVVRGSVLPMKAGALIMSLTLIVGVAACGGAPNTFRVKADRNVASAELRLCGKNKHLQRLGDSFVGAQIVTCEGGGVIVIRSENRPTTCILGYVTPGAPQDFSFVVEDGICRPA